jgi:hypothetical protein
MKTNNLVHSSLSQRLNNLKEINQQKVNCEDIQKEFTNQFTFLAKINESNVPIQLVHLADWSQFYFIEDNPRYF